MTSKKIYIQKNNDFFKMTFHKKWQVTNIKANFILVSQK